jgi:hypothetical protein
MSRGVAAVTLPADAAGGGGGAGASSGPIGGGAAGELHAASDTAVAAAAAATVRSERAARGEGLFIERQRAVVRAHSRIVGDVVG